MQIRDEKNSYSESGMGKIRIRDGKNSDPGSGINLGSATLVAAKFLYKDFLRRRHFFTNRPGNLESSWQHHWSRRRSCGRGWRSWRWGRRWRRSGRTPAKRRTREGVTAKLALNIFYSVKYGETINKGWNGGKYACKCYKTWPVLGILQRLLNDL